MKKTIYLITMLVLLVPSFSNAEYVTYTFTSTISDGLLAGESGFGSFTFDDFVLISGVDRIAPLLGLTLTFEFQGQTFTEVNDLDYFDEDYDYPVLSFNEFIPVYLDFILIDGVNGVNFDYPDSIELRFSDITPMTDGYDFDIALDATVVPIPGAIFMFASGLLGFGFFTSKKRNNS